MKSIKTLVLLFLIPVLAFCFFGCNGRSVELNKENIEEYVIISQTAGDISNLDGTYSCTFTIEICSKDNNLTFKDSIVKILMTPSQSVFSTGKEIKLNSSGSGKTTFFVTANSISSITSASYKINSVSGTVIIGG